MPNHIVIGGQNGCGKSTLTASVYKQLESMGVNVGIHEVDVYSDTLPCILGLKSWEKRKKKKHAWFNPTIYRRIQEFANDQRDIVLGDLPGKIKNPFLTKMVEPADRAIIVAKDLDTLIAWDAFFKKQSIPVALRVVSHRGSRPPVAEPLASTVFVQGLDRQILVNDEIRCIALKLSELCIPRVLLTG